MEVTEGSASTRYGPFGSGPGEHNKSLLARSVMMEYPPVPDWPTEHVPSRIPGDTKKWADFHSAAGVA